MNLRHLSPSGFRLDVKRTSNKSQMDTKQLPNRLQIGSKRAPKVPNFHHFGDPLEVNCRSFRLLGDHFQHMFCLEMLAQCQVCPNRHHPRNKLTLLGTLLGSKIVKKQCLHYHEPISRNDLSNVSQKRPCSTIPTSPKCVRGIEIQGFAVLMQIEKTMP